MLKVYPCDQKDSCLGGCQFNSSCSTKHNNLSPTCGVCINGYYMTDGQCYQCTIFKSILPILMFWYFVTFLIFSFGLSAIIWYNIKSSLPQSSSSSTLQSSTELSMSNSYDPNDPTLGRSHLPHRRTFQSRLSAVLNLKLMSSYFDNTQHQRARKKVFRGTSMTFKLVLSFIQVVSGSVYIANIHWSNKTNDLLHILNFNPLHAIDATFQCSSINYSDDFRSFLVLTVYFLFPIVFLILLFIISYLVYLYASNILSKDGSSSSSSSSTSTPQESNPFNSRESGASEMKFSESISLSIIKSESMEQKKCYEKLKLDTWNISAKIFLWFCLISYPSLSSGLVYFVLLLFYFFIANFLLL